MPKDRILNNLTEEVKNCQSFSAQSFLAKAKENSINFDEILVFLTKNHDPLDIMPRFFKPGVFIHIEPGSYSEMVRSAHRNLDEHTLKKLKDEEKFSSELLLNAAKTGKITAEIVKSCLEAGADPNFTGDNQESSIDVLAKHLKTKELKQIKIINTLIEAGAEIQFKKTPNIMKVLVDAEDNCQEKAFDKLLKSGGNLNIEDEFGQTALMHAAKNGHHEHLQALINAGAKVNLIDDFGQNALIQAAKKGHLQNVQALVKAGACVNYVNHFGNSALIYAAENGHPKTTKALLDAGALINFADKHMETALIHAAKKGHVDVAKVLIEYGADLNLQNNHGNTALQITLIMQNLAKNDEEHHERFEHFQEIQKMLEDRIFSKQIVNIIFSSEPHLKTAEEILAKSSDANLTLFIKQNPERMQKILENISKDDFQFIHKIFSNPKMQNKLTTIFAHSFYAKVKNFFLRKNEENQGLKEQYLKFRKIFQENPSMEHVDHCLAMKEFDRKIGIL